MSDKVYVNESKWAIGKHVIILRVVCELQNPCLRFQERFAQNPGGRTDFTKLHLHLLEGRSCYNFQSASSV